MKISDVLTMKEYDDFCKASLSNKVPDWRDKDWRMKVGDCIYDYTHSEVPILRKGVHQEKDKRRDLSGLNALLSDHFYYFGEEARPIPEVLKPLIKHNQGHQIIRNEDLIRKFEKWIRRFKKNKLYSDLQLRSRFDKNYKSEMKLVC